MFKLCRRLGRLRVLLAMMFAIISSALPAAVYAQIDCYHGASAMNRDVDEIAHAEKIYANIQDDHKSDVKSDFEQKRFHHNTMRDSCRSVCVSFGAILVNTDSHPGFCSARHPLATESVRIRGQTIVPPLGPPRFQA